MVIGGDDENDNVMAVEFFEVSKIIIIISCSLTIRSCYPLYVLEFTRLTLRYESNS